MLWIALGYLAYRFARDLRRPALTAAELHALRRVEEEARATRERIAWEMEQTVSLDPPRGTYGTGALDGVRLGERGVPSPQRRAPSVADRAAERGVTPEQERQRALASAQVRAATDHYGEWRPDGLVLRHDEQED